MKNKNISKFATSLIYMALGIALILKPTLVEDVVCYLLAAAAVAVGLLKLVTYSFTKVETRIAEDTNGFAIGCSLILLGIFVLLKGTMIVILIPFILGFMITFKGIEGIQNVINLKKFGYGTSKGVLVASLIITIFGIIVMLNPFATARVLFIMLGIGLLVSGLADIIADVVFTRHIKLFEKNQKEQNDQQ